MKKIICIAAAMLCALTAAPFTASAIEAGTYADRREKTEQQGITEFPDPEAKYTVVTEGDLEFRLYDEFALLSDCKNTDVTAVEIPAAVKELPVVGCAEEPFRFCRSRCFTSTYAQSELKSIRSAPRFQRALRSAILSICI